MKKIKLFALVAFAMLSTNAFAQSFADVTDDTWQYTVNPDPDDVTKPSSTATLVGLVDSKKGTVENLEIPAQVTGAGNYKYTVVGIGDGAFENDAKIKTVTFTANIEYINDDAFNNCYNMTTVTFPAGSKLNFIGNGAFAETASLEKIDLSNTKVFSFYNEGDPTDPTDDIAYTPFVDAGLNVSLEEIVLAANTYDIGTALAGLAALKKTNIASTRIQTLRAGAFTGDKKLTSVELPAIYYFNPVTGEKDENPQNTTLLDNALAGSFIQTLTVNGAIGTGGVGVLGATGAAGAPTLTTVIFNGVVGDGTNVAIVDGAFDGNYTLTTATFAKVKAKAIGEGSFEEAALDPSDPTKLKGKLTFTVTDAPDANPVFENAKVFAAAALADVTKNNVDIKAPNAAVGALAPMHRANFTPSVAPVVAQKIKVYGETTCYGKFINETGAAVAINRADAIVYSAYVDGSKAYMDPLQVVKGQQIIEDGEAVVIKAVKTNTADDGSKYIEIATKADGTPATTMHYADNDADATYDLLNDIDCLDYATYGDDGYESAATLKATQPTKVLYVLGDLTKGINWQTPKDAVRLYSNTLYLFADAAAAGGRLEVIWLDGSEEATAIKTVKKVAEKGAIYNLAGQKVNASYKGVVIKDGKKFIQK